jgi:hypothetical protein
LHFGPDGLVWECKSFIACECRILNHELGFKGKYHEACNSEKTRSDVTNSQSICDILRATRKQERDGLLRDFRAKQQDAVDADTWHMVVANFSRRKLTYQSDRLPALSGLAEVSALPFRGTYIAGHWSNTLMGDLIWKNTNTQQTKNAEFYIAPA